MAEDPNRQNILGGIRELKAQEPFAPFEILVSSGDRFRIDAAANLVEMQTEFFYAYPGSDRFALIRMNQIVAVERLGSDRRPKRRRAS
jgi:hypothetical protein